jgi:hypothetical protein
MLFFQIAVIGILVLLYSCLLVVIFRKFGLKTKDACFFIVPLIIYSVGFVLRVNHNIDVVNLGYYLTDFTGLFVTVLFTSFLLFGQLKFWKIK